MCSVNELSKQDCYSFKQITLKPSKNIPTRDPQGLLQLQGALLAEVPVGPRDPWRAQVDRHVITRGPR